MLYRTGGMRINVSMYVTDKVTASGQPTIQQILINARLMQGKNELHYT
jgi:hypothetical protein